MQHSLLELGYHIERKFIPKTKIKHLVDTIDHSFQAFPRRSDNQVPDALLINNNPGIEILLFEKITKIEKLVQKELAPSVLYGRVYQHGNILKPHLDGGHCEYSISVNIYKDHDWPFELTDLKDKHIQAELEPGDAIYYLGPKVTHWRNAYKGKNFIQLFLHYVDINGPYQECAYKWTYKKDRNVSLFT